MTYGELLASLYELSPEQLRTDVCIYDMNNDEVIPVVGAAVVGLEDEQDCRPDGVLDDNHPYLIID